MRSPPLRWMIFLVALMGFWIGVTALVNAAEPASDNVMVGTVSGSMDLAKNELPVLLPHPFGVRDLVVQDSDARLKLQRAEQGDVVKVDVDNPLDPQQIKKLESLGRPVPGIARLVVMGVSGAFLLLLAGAATGWRPQRFIIGVDNRYSNSQTQIVLWFGVVAVIYLSAVVLRFLYLGSDFIGGVSLPEHLIELSSLSALTFGGAKAITVQKIATAQQAAPNQVVKPAAARANFFRDLFTNDTGGADFGDFQMILITFAAAAIFALSAGHFFGLLMLNETTTLPDVDSTLLAGFGVGQGAYLVKKAAVKVGEG